ncbi:hypothetical protein VWY34_15465 [Phaeobacter sp. JH20_02]|uniref:hypothetical protein n=1 Tax=Phaeobacter sp. JH20_02 TaxID=3112461 RepID=UPI003A85B2F7
MANQRNYLHTLFRGLVVRHFPGKQNCAARELAEFWAGRELDDSEVDYGGFSRKMNGSRAFDIYDLFALIRITGDKRILLPYGEADEGDLPPSIPMPVLAARAAKESGESVSAAIEGGDLAEIAREAGEAEAAHRKIREEAEALMRSGPDPDEDGAAAASSGGHSNG